MFEKLLTWFVEVLPDLKTQSRWVKVVLAVVISVIIALSLFSCSTNKSAMRSPRLDMQIKEGRIIYSDTVFYHPYQAPSRSAFLR